MKNLIILILLAVIAYLLYTSGILSRAVRSVQDMVVGTPDPNATPAIYVTVYSPYGTGGETRAAPAPRATSVIARPTAPAPINPQPVVAPLNPSMTPLPAQPAPSVEPPATLTPPPPTIIIPEVPPTLAVATTPTPAGVFVITIDAPREGETVRTSPLIVSGQTAPHAVVSVNDAVAIAGPDGRFNLSVPLEAGPNVLEIIASKPTGEQVFAILTVLYQP
jgi:hypothetical protein